MISTWYLVLGTYSIIVRYLLLSTLLPRKRKHDAISHGMFHDRPIGTWESDGQRLIHGAGRSHDLQFGSGLKAGRAVVCTLWSSLEYLRYQVSYISGITRKREGWRFQKQRVRVRTQWYRTIGIWIGIGNGVWY